MEEQKNSVNHRHIESGNSRQSAVRVAAAMRNLNQEPETLHDWRRCLSMRRKM